jgi:hypothetical protein
MHRSGTSMLANIISEAGIESGDSNKLLPATLRGNNWGFFENEEIVNFNYKLFKKYNAHWDDPYNIDLENEAIIYDNKLYSEAKSIIKSLFKNNGNETIFIKDPKSSIVLNFWKKVLHEYIVEYIYIYRHPYEVAKSLEIRNQYSFEKSIKLWIYYNTAIMKFINYNKSLVVSYDNIINKPLSEIDRILSYLKIKVNDLIIQKVFSAVSPTSRHSKIYKKIDEIELRNIYNSIVKEFELSYKKFPLRKIDYKIDYEQQYLLLQNKINHLDSVIQHRDKELNNAENIIKYNEFMITELKTHLEESNMLVQSNEKIINSRLCNFILKLKKIIHNV